MILELRRAVLIPYYYIIIFILCREAAGVDGGVGVTTDKDNRKQLVLIHQESWCEFQICDDRLAERGGHWRMHPTPLSVTTILNITRCTKRITNLSLGIGAESIGRQ